MTWKVGHPFLIKESEVNVRPKPVEPTTVIGRDLGLMIRAFASALEDEHLLVRRGVLDLLVQSLRLGGPAIKQ